VTTYTLKQLGQAERNGLRRGLIMAARIAERGAEEAKHIPMNGIEMDATVGTLTALAVSLRLAARAARDGGAVDGTDG